MSAPKPLPTLPAGHPLRAQVEQWTQLRDQLNNLVAQLEYMRLMMRLDQRRG